MHIMTLFQFCLRTSAARIIVNSLLFSMVSNNKQTKKQVNDNFSEMKIGERCLAN